jgi:hypothetical protein
LATERPSQAISGKKTPVNFPNHLFLFGKRWQRDCERKENPEVDVRLPARRDREAAQSEFVGTQPDVGISAKRLIGGLNRHQAVWATCVETKHTSICDGCADYRD